MTASYDSENNTITVNLRHRTLDGISHRISSYEVIVEDETLEFVRDSQDGNNPTETLALGDIEITEDSKVTIIANCSFYGSLKRNYYFSDSNLFEEDNQDN